MPAKKKSTSTLTRQRNAAHKAQRERRWETAITNYTRALAHKNLSADVQIDLLEGRASCYKKTGNLKAEALDLKTLSILLRSQLEGQSEVLEQSQAELGILSSIAGALVDQADYESIGRLVGHKVQEFFKAEIAGVAFYNDRSGMLDVVYYYERGKLKQVPSFRYGQGATSYVIKSRRPLYIATEKDSKKYGAIYTEEFPSQSALYAPLISGKRALGAISIQDRKANAYSNHDLRILNAIAGSMSVALENARLFDEIQNSNREITETLGQQTATSEILRAMANSPTEIQPILDAVANNAAKLCEADDVQIYSVEADRLGQVAHYGPLPALQDGETLPLVPGLVVGRSVLEHRTIQIEDFLKLSASEYPQSVKLQKRLGHRTALSIPLLRKGSAIGAIVVRRNEVRLFTERQIALLATFADQAAIAIENVRLFEQLQTRNREISEALELQTATSDILQIIASSPEDIDRVLSAIAEKAALLCNSDDAVISYGEGGFLNVRAHYGSIPFLKVGDRAGVFNRETVVGRAIIDGKPVQAIHNQRGMKSEFPVGDKFAKRFGYALTLAAPLLFQGKANGGIFIRRVEPVLFSEREISLLQSFANQAVIAIEKARLLSETKRLLAETTQRNREITEALELQTATSSILEIIASSPENIDGVLSIIAEKAAILLKSEDAVIHYAEGDFFVTRAHYGPIPFFTLGKDMRFNRESVTGRAIIDGRTIQAIHNSKGKKSEFPLGDKTARHFGYALTCAAPLLFQGKTIGAIMIRRVEPTLFSEKEISLLQNFANQAVIAIEKARLVNETNRLLEETTQRNREITEALDFQTATSGILEVIASSPESIDSVLSIIAEKAALLLKSDDAVINYVEGGFFNARAHYGLIPFFKLGAGTPFNRETVTGRAIIDRIPIQAIHNVKGKKSEFPLGDKAAKQFGYALTCAAPLLFQGKAIGAIMIRRVEPTLFSEKDISLLQNFANQAVIAIEKARLLNETKRLLEETTKRNGELAVINSVQQGLASRLRFQEIVDLVGEKVGEIFNADTANASMYDAQRDWTLNTYYVDRGRRIPFADGPLLRPSLTAVVADTRQPLLLGTQEEQEKWGLRLVPRSEKEGDQNESYLSVPILTGEKLVGVITVRSYHANAFNQNDLHLLETLANSMSVALENARLFDETAQRNAELAVINSVQEAMAKRTDIQGIYEAVGEKIRGIFGAQAMILGQFDHSSSLVLAHYFYEKGERLYPSPLPFTGLIKHLISTRQTIVINEDFEAKAQELGMIIPAGEGSFNQNDLRQLQTFANSKSAVFVPLVAGEKVIGGISLQNADRENAFSDSDVRLLETLANSMSVALENARLFSETAQRNAELAVINSVQEAMAKQLDIKSIYEAVGEKIRGIFDAQAVILGSFDHASSLVLPHYFYEKGERFYPDPYSFSCLMRHLISTRETVVINEGFAAKAKEFGMIIRAGESAKSGVFVPLVAGDKVIGAISLQNIDQENAFSISDVRLLETLANGMSVALENARLFDETSQRNAELAVITSVQQGLASRLKFQEIVDLVGDKVGEIFKADTVNAAMYDAQRDWFINAYYVDRGRRISRPDGPRPRPSLSAAVVDTRQPLLLGTQEEQKKRGAVSIPRTEEEGDQNESVLFVPILAGEKVIGVISVQSYQKNAFNQNDLHLLQTLANSMSVALENARLFDETAQRNAELAVINTVQAALADELDIQTIYDTVGEKLREIFHVGAITINIYDLEADTNSYVYGFEDGQRTPNLTVPINAMHRSALEQGSTFLVNEGFQEYAARFGAKAPQGKLPKSALWVQLPKRGNRITAVILMDIEHENAFTQSDVRLLETLASSMSAALENARLFDESNRLLEETQVKAAELTTINTVGQALASELELDSLIQLIGEQVRTIFKADIAYLALYDQADGMIRFPYIRGETLEPLKLGEGIVSQIIRTGEPLLINRDEGWKMAEQNVDRVGVRAKSYLGVPILVGKNAIGAISVQSTQKEGRFDAADMNLLSTIAANVGSAIENARLFAEVARQKEYFETFFQYSPAAVVVVDFNGNVISWNPAAESLFGYTAQEAIGKDVDDLVANDPRVEAEARRNTQKFIGERGRVEVKGRRTRKDGSLVDVEVKGLPISVEGEMVGLLVIYHDISEIEQARRAAEEANRAKSAFLANMSHELRTPLNAIIGFTRLVRRKGEGSLPEKQVENLDKVLISAEHLLGLINTILDIAKIEAGRMELQLSDFDLSALIDSCLATTQPLVKTSDIKLLKSMPQGLPQMHSDQEKIRQILLNLLSNAAKFTHEGSIKVVGKLKGEMIVLSVEDSGIGIAEENLHKIFEEFQQADNTTTRQYGGTGLGLSISRSLARLLDGDLTASSVEGEGSTFSLTIPLHQGKPGSGTDDVNEAISQADIPLEPDKPLVLVIDDQPDMFHILQQNLEGYQVVGALSGEEGIEKARTLHPTAITLDIMMPRKDGWQVLHELKNDPETRDIPVIILTIVDNKAMGFRLGASDYLVKPLNEKLMREALERVTKSNGGVRPRRLLVVDDDPQVIDLIQQMFQGQDFSIAMAKDGAEALDRIRQSQPDVILLDLVMPKLDGFQFIHEVQKKPKLRKIPIIVLTAKSLSNEELSRLQKSVATIVKKQGLDGEALIKEIQKVIV